LATETLPPLLSP
jgi:hypothetical protein